jgi:hypothetical protein
MSSRLRLATLTVLMTAVMAPSMMHAQARAAAKTRVVVAPGTQATVQATSITTMTATPATISFSSTDPDLGPVAGSSSATIVIALKGQSVANTWTLGISAGAATFTGCATVPASAVTATCSSVVVSGTTGPTPGTGACGSAVGLSTTSTTVASGKEGSNKDTYTATINFTLTDSWQYIAATSPTCPLTLTYSVNAP